MRFDPQKLSDLDSVEYFYPFGGDDGNGVMTETQRKSKGKF